MRKILLVISALLLLLPTVSLAQARYITYPGAGFTPMYDTGTWTVDGNGGVYTAFGGTLLCQCNFPNAANGKKIRMISATYLDKDVTGQLAVILLRKDRWTGVAQIVGFLNTGVSDASDFIQNKTIFGSPPITNRIINNNRYQFFFVIAFDVGGPDLTFHSVTLKYS